MKQETRKLISGLIAAALMTSIFTGCSKQEESSIPFSSTSIVSDVETPTGETKLYRDETLDMRYKHWYDNPEVTSSQKEINEKALAGTDTGEKYMNMFTIYTDENDNQYYLAGRTPTYLTGDTEDNHGAWELRDPETGRLKYPVLVDNDISKVSENLTPSSDYSDYISDTKYAEIGDDVKYNVYLNNIDMKATFAASDKVMPISKWLGTYALATLYLPEDMTATTTSYLGFSEVPTLYLCTGAGQCEITFETIDDPDDEFDGGWQIEYKSEGFEQAVSKSEITISNGILSASPRAIESVLGFKLIVSNETKTINIITDNKDLADSNSVIDDATPLEPEPEPTPEQPSTNDEPTTSGNDEPTTPTQPTQPQQPTQSTQPTQPQQPTQSTKPTQPTTPTQPSSSNQYTGLTPTDTTGMELDANGFPATPNRGDFFVDKTGQKWQYLGRNGWAECGVGAQGSVSTAEGTGELVGF